MNRILVAVLILIGNPAFACPHLAAREERASPLMAEGETGEVCHLPLDHEEEAPRTVFRGDASANSPTRGPARVRV